MMSCILDFIARKQAELCIPVGRVLEVGSRNINGSVRQVLGGLAESWLGIDIEPGDGVDVRMNGEELYRHFPPESFDTVVCCETLEHTLRPIVIVNQMRKVLRCGGHLWISTPDYGFPEHKFPFDCYRFGEDCYRMIMFAEMDLLALAHVEDGPSSPAIVAVGRLPSKEEMLLRR